MTFDDGLASPELISLSTASHSDSPIRDEEANQLILSGNDSTKTDIE